MTDHSNAERDALEYQNMLMAFQRSLDGRGYAYRITGTVDAYTFTARSKTITVTRDEIKAQGLENTIQRIVSAWEGK